MTEISLPQPMNYRERQKALAAEARAAWRLAELEQRRRRELVNEALRLATEAVIVELRYKGLKISQFKPRDIAIEAKARMPHFVEMARERIAARQNKT